MSLQASHSREPPRGRIGKLVRALRIDRRWTQLELAQPLGLSQSRLSEIERGDGSFSAEQFLQILKLFNVSVGHFADSAGDREAQLQNTLARLGTGNLRENQDVLPADDLEDVADVVRETLIRDNPRLVVAAASVLVTNHDRISLGKLFLDLAKIGRERRLGWLVENVVDAIRRRLGSGKLSRSEGLRERRASLVFENFLDSVVRGLGPAGELLPDILDPTIRSKQSLRDVEAASSAISRRWGIVTGIQPEDFFEALAGR
jgi:transcriptional regulator with XRE-family HTH domain